MSMSRADSTVETCFSRAPERCWQAVAKLLSAVTRAFCSAASSGVTSVAVKASICLSVRHLTGSLRATPRGSTAAMS